MGRSLLKLQPIRLYMAEGDGQAEELPWKDCLGQNESSELDNALFFDYEFSIDQLMEIAGLCVAQVTIKHRQCNYSPKLAGLSSCA